MVAERLRTLPACDLDSPCFIPRAAMAGIPESVIAEQAFVPTHIPIYQGEVVGDALLEFSCKALLYGQCLMSVGGYIVRGTILACKRRAKANRIEIGAFERVEPKYITSVLVEFSMSQRLASPGQPQQQPLALGWDDTAAAASEIYSQMVVESSPGPELCLQQTLDEQAEDDASELPYQERRELFEVQVQQQFEQDTATQARASLGMGKRSLTTEQ